MTQRIRVLAAKADNQDWIPGTHMVEENRLPPPPVFSDLHIHIMAHKHTHLHKFDERERRGWGSNSGMVWSQTESLLG